MRGEEAGVALAVAAVLLCSRLGVADWLGRWQVIAGVAVLAVLSGLAWVWWDRTGQRRG